MKQQLIDTTKQPSIINDLTIESHDTSQGQIDPIEIGLYLDEIQKDGKYIEGNKLREKLKSQPVLNACVLNYLLKNPDLIPDDWKGKYVYFWGTIYRSSAGRLYVRYLFWNGVRWNENYSWLGIDWLSFDPAAVRDSKLFLGSLPDILTINGIKYQQIK